MRRLAALLALLPACRPAPAETPADVVGRFYAAVIASQEHGAPGTAALAAWAPLLSDTLRALLDGARRLREADLARAPDQKPAFAEGDLFSSLFEGPTAVTVLSDDSTSGRHAIAVQMTNAGATPAVSWTDIVWVTREHGHPVIDDVEYGGTWDFANQGRLRAALVAALTPE